MTSQTDTQPRTSFPIGTRVKLAGSSAVYFVLKAEGPAAFLVPNSANVARFVDAANVYTVATHRLMKAGAGPKPLHPAWVAWAAKAEEAGA